VRALTAMAIAAFLYACAASKKDPAGAAEARRRTFLSGALSAVFAALDIQPKKACALKVCSSEKPEECQWSSDVELEAYACASWKQRVSCLDAIEKAPIPMSDSQTRIVRQYYLNQNGDADCYRTNPLLDGAFRTSVWHTDRNSGWLGFEHAIQVAPTVTLGIPFLIHGDGNAAKAIAKGGTVTGLNVRYTPLSYVASIDAFIGTMDADTASLDPERFPSPRFVVIGAGVDAVAGILGFSVVNARLRGDGLFGENRDSTWFTQITIDLAAVTTMVAGAATKGEEN